MVMREEELSSVTMKVAGQGIRSIPAVRRMARVAVISPASYPQPERLTRGVDALGRMGFLPTVGRQALAKAHHYFAGTTQARLDDLHGAFLDPAVEAIFCSRGGYGCNYLLKGLDLGLVREHPKPLIAYSDMTCMQTWLLDQAGLVSFHGPMVAADFSAPDGVDEASLLAALRGDRWFVGEASGLRTLIPGKATGTLYGGCITLLAASLGTPHAPRTEGKLLFLEDRDVKPYQLDRLLRQMILAGKFEGVRGIIFGEMLDCVAPGQKPELLDEVILRVLDWFQGPIAIGLRSGHVSRRNVTLAFGIAAELHLGRAPVLSFLERANEK
jgi:muramoyltetrapeptide carboxypeptidase